ncbi:MAG: hypothetical protein HYY87_02375 [Candidatus Levybacteria bacterium]|nr:hypothetical protein [Candidatus Levybacteria bacterium]
MKRSRLARRLEQQSKRNLLISALGILAVLFLLFKFGLPLLINFTLFISGFKNSQETAEKSVSFVAPPVLNPLPSATNSAEVVISGSALQKQTVMLYLDGALVDKMKADKDGNFLFEEVKLTRGTNIIKARAMDEKGKESENSQQITVLFKSDLPLLTIDSPNEGQSFSKDDKTAQVKGKTDPGVKVTVNDFWAIVDESGNFSYQLPLRDGENKIKVIAVDEAGNKTETERKVNYSP